MQVEITADEVKEIPKDSIPTVKTRDQVTFEAVQDILALCAQGFTTGTAFFTLAIGARTNKC